MLTDGTNTYIANWKTCNQWVIQQSKTMVLRSGTNTYTATYVQGEIWEIRAVEGVEEK